MKIIQDFISPKIAYQQARIAYWNRVALKRDYQQGLGNWYHRRMEEEYRFLVGSGQRVLEIGCGTGDLLNSLQPSRVMGIDFSPEMLQRARTQYPQLEFAEADALDLTSLTGPFDAIMFSDIVNDLWDVQGAFEQVQPLFTTSTHLIIDFYSRLWQIPLSLAQRFNLADPFLDKNWLTREFISRLLNLAGFGVIRITQENLWLLPFGQLANRLLVRFWPFYQLALSTVILVSSLPKRVNDNPSISVVVPARNESGNIKSIIKRTPQMVGGTELIFIEGHSRDDTFDAIEHECTTHLSIPCLLLRQTGIGKADAVRLGFSKASGDVLIVLDADQTVLPEDLPRIYDALFSAKGEFINGVWLIYPMEKKAMCALNFLDNKFISLAFSWLLGQKVKDTVCGTKCLWRKDYEKIVANPAYFCDFDPFGDFDLIIGATKLNLRIIDLPVRYRKRIYGSTNITRWKHGLLLLCIVAIVAQQIKFI